MSVEWLKAHQFAESMGAWSDVAVDLTEEQSSRLDAILQEVDGQIEGVGAETRGFCTVLADPDPPKHRVILSTVAYLWLRGRTDEFGIRFHDRREEMYLGGKWRAADKQTEFRP